VAPLAGAAGEAAVEPPVGDDAGPGALADEHHDGVVGVAGRAEPRLGLRGRLGAVVDVGGDAQVLAEAGEVGAVPADDLGVHQLPVLLHDPRHAETEPDHPPGVDAQLGEHRGDLVGDRRAGLGDLDAAALERVGGGGEPVEAEVEHLDADLRLADVRPDDQPGVVRDAHDRPAAPALGVQEALLAHRALGEELVHQVGDGGGRQAGGGADLAARGGAAEPDLPQDQGAVAPPHVLDRRLLGHRDSNHWFNDCFIV